jgi:RND family efflux transporter MFP subunit
VNRRPKSVVRRPSFIAHRFLFIVHCSLLLLLLAACSPPGANIAPTFVPPSTYGPPVGSTYTVTRGSMVETIAVRGRVVAKQEALLVFPVGGTLKAVHVTPGDQVEAGALVAELDAPGAERDVLLAEIDVELAGAELRLAELRLAELALEQDRPQATGPGEVTISTEPEGPYSITIPLPTDAAPEVAVARIAVRRAEEELKQAAIEWDKAIHRDWVPPEVTERYTWTLQLRTWNYQVAQLQLAQVQQERLQVQWERLQAQQALSVTRAIQELQVETAKTRVERARFLSLQASKQLSSTQLTAPLSGVVVSIEKRPGDQVGAYETIGTVADPSELWVVTTVLEEDVDRIAVGQPATIRFDIYPNEEYAGTVLQVISQAIVWQDNRAYEVTVALDESQDIPVIIGMGADVAITGRSRENVLLVPSQAILIIGGRKYVEVVTEEGSVDRVEIQTGISDDTETEVLSGLQANQVIRTP